MCSPTRQASRHHRARARSRFAGASHGHVALGSTITCSNDEKEAFSHFGFGRTPMKKSRQRTRKGAELAEQIAVQGPRAGTARLVPAGALKDRSKDISQPDQQVHTWETAVPTNLVIASESAASATA